MLLFSFQHSCLQFMCNLLYLLVISNKIILTRLNCGRPERDASSDVICVKVRECLRLKSRLKGSCAVEKCWKNYVKWSWCSYPDCFVFINCIEGKWLQRLNYKFMNIFERLYRKIWFADAGRQVAVTNAFLLFRRPLELISCQKQCILKIAR